MKCGKNLSREREYIVVIKMPGGKAEEEGTEA